MDLRYKLSRLREKLVTAIAFTLPRQVAYWAAIRVGAHATTGRFENQIVPDLTFIDALKRWEMK